MATTAQRRAAIRAATEAARLRAIARREARVAQVEQAYAQAAAAVAAWLREHAGSDGRVPAEALAQFDAFLDGLLRELGGRWHGELSGGLVEAASIAAALAPAGYQASVTQRALAQLREFVAADGLQLSDRVWRVDQATRSTINDVLRGAIERGATARQAAAELLMQGSAVPSEVALLLRDATPEQIARRVSSSLMRAEGNPLRNALRIMRTEINRAHTEAFVAAAFEHPDVGAVKFNLSPLHPRPDRCDFHAAANLHGLGRGVYPQGQHPYPAHPETLSYLTVVFEDEISDADRAGQQTAFEWLRAQPAATQAAVLGQHKAAALRRGELLESELTTPWRDVRARLEATP